MDADQKIKLWEICKKTATLPHDALDAQRQVLDLYLAGDLSMSQFQEMTGFSQEHSLMLFAMVERFIELNRIRVEVDAAQQRGDRREADPIYPQLSQLLTQMEEIQDWIEPWLMEKSQ
jgi:hypothetical protein